MSRHARRRRARNLRSSRWGGHSRTLELAWAYYYRDKLCFGHARQLAIAAEGRGLVETVLFLNHPFHRPARRLPLATRVQQKRLAASFPKEEFWFTLDPSPSVPTCLRCQNTAGVEPERVRTCYPGGPKANPPLNLCRECATEYHAYWDERWAEHRGGLL